MPEKKNKINIHGVRDDLKKVLGQLDRVRPQTPEQAMLLKRKKKQLRALRTLTRAAVCPETWDVWPPDPRMEMRTKRKMKKK